MGEGVGTTVCVYVLHIDEVESAKKNIKLELVQFPYGYSTLLTCITPAAEMI